MFSDGVFSVPRCIVDVIEGVDPGCQEAKDPYSGRGKRQAGRIEDQAGEDQRCQDRKIFYPVEGAKECHTGPGGGREGARRSGLAGRRRLFIRRDGRPVCRSRCKEGWGHVGRLRSGARWPGSIEDGEPWDRRWHEKNIHGVQSHSKRCQGDR